MTDFAATRRAFHLPHGITYLDGNSLGPMPVAASERVARMMADEWSEMLITGWNCLRIGLLLRHLGRDKSLSALPMFTLRSWRGNAPDAPTPVARASGRASVSLERRSVYFQASTRRCGNPSAA